MNEKGESGHCKPREIVLWKAKVLGRGFLTAIVSQSKLIHRRIAPPNAQYQIFG
jgi:hypothetical protein